MKLGDKLYVVSRRDLEPGYQAVQGQHALFQFSVEHTEAAKRWYSFSNYLAFLSVKDSDELLALLDRALAEGVKVSAFHEPDVGNAITAIAMEPGELTKRLCSSAQLALKGAREK